MYSYEKDESVPFSVRENDRAWGESYKKHKERLAKIKTGPGKFSLNEDPGGDFLHLRLKLKKLQLEEDRYAHIDYENRKLLNRLIHIMKAPPRLDNWNNEYKRTRSLHGDYRKIQDKKIRKENKVIYNRLQHVRPMSLSAPAIPDLMLKTRERIRASEEKKIQEENLALRRRINSIRSQVSTTPLSEFDRQSMREASRGSRKPGSRQWGSSKSVPLYNYKEKKVVEDNLALHNRLMNVRGTIDFKEMDRQTFKTPRRQPRRTISADEVHFIENNLQLQRQVARVVTSLQSNKHSSDSDERQKSRASNIKSLKAAIKVENSVAEGYLTKRKKKQDKQNNDGKYGGFTGPYAKENYQLHQRILDIKKGKRKVDIWRNTFPEQSVDTRQHTNTQSKTNGKGKSDRKTRLPASKGRKGTKTSRSDGEDQSNGRKSGETNALDEEQEDSGSDSFQSIHSWGEVKEDTKNYNVPPGYRKKFRKRRKKKQETQETHDADFDSEQQDTPAEHKSE